MIFRFLPNFELCRFKNINFFPIRPDSLSDLDSICIGSKSRTIGDTLVLSTLPESLKKKFPHLKIYSYPRAFNPVVFFHNPHIEGIQYLPDALFGDDINWGEGHLIQLKERFFDLPITANPKPKIYLTEREKNWAHHTLIQKKQDGKKVKPLCLIHPWGGTCKNVAQHKLWNKVIYYWKDRVHFWQLGMKGQEQISGCAHYFFSTRSFWNARKIFSLFSRADFFIGVDSGPMHVARAFEIPSLIFIEEGNPDEIFKMRKQWPFFLHRNFARAFLYETNLHLNIPDLTELEIMDRFDLFFKKTKSIT